MAMGIEVVPTRIASMVVATSGANTPMATPMAIATKIHRLR